MHFTDEQPFLEAIFERDADDRPRLVYADYLDDSGEPERAELVRVQLALARIAEDDPRRPELSERQAELLNRNRAKWTAHLAGLVVSVDFRRGVPDSASVEASTFLTRGAELFDRLPVRRVRLLDAAPLMAKIAVCPLMGRVRELDLCNAELGTAGVTNLARSRCLNQLVSLDLGFNGLSDTDVGILARSTGLSSLTHLSLNDNDRIGSDGLRALAESPFFTSLVSLDVSGNDIGEHGLRALVESQTLPRLREFRAHGNPISDAGAVALAGSDLFDRMVKAHQHLALRGNMIGPVGASALTVCPALMGCATVDLTNNYLGDQGLASILSAPWIDRVRVLRLARNQITDSGIANARDTLSALFNTLTILDLSGNRSTRVGLSILSAVRGDRPVRVEVGGNVQSPAPGDAPVAVSELIDGVTEAARLRHRVTHPVHPTNES